MKLRSTRIFQRLRTLTTQKLKNLHSKQIKNTNEINLLAPVGKLYWRLYPSSDPSQLVYGRISLESVAPIVTVSPVSGSGFSYISDEELLEEYRNCDIVNFPSLYEGIGMPIIEGQATGRVVVTSNLSPMKDVAGGASILVNPRDVLSIRKGYIEAINNGDKYVEKGLENVKRFSVSSITIQYFNLIKELFV